jgi:quinol monooxygenase YgiN
MSNVAQAARGSGHWRIAMESSRPVTVIMSFRLLPSCLETWLEAWKGLRGVALSQSACRQCHLLRNRHDPNHRVVLSEWDSASDFDAFVRKTGLTWLNRCLRGTSDPPEYSILEPIPLKTYLTTQEEARHLVPVG